MDQKDPVSDNPYLFAHCISSKKSLSTFQAGDEILQFPLCQSLASICHDPNGGASFSQPSLQSVSTALSRINPWNFLPSKDQLIAGAQAPLSLFSSLHIGSNQLQQKTEQQQLAEAEIEKATKIVDTYLKELSPYCEAFKRSCRTTSANEALKKQKAKKGLEELQVPKEFFTPDFSPAAEHSLFVSLCSTAVVPYLAKGSGTITKVQRGVYTTKPSAVQTNDLISSLSGTTSELAVKKLEFWIDAIEMRLVEEVSDKTSLFMECSLQLNKLWEDVQHANRLLISIQNDMSQSRLDLVYNRFQVPRLCLRRKNLQSLRKVLTTMNAVQVTPQRVEALLSANKNVDALDILNASERLFEAEGFKRISVMKDIPTVFFGLSQRIDSALEMSFAKTCLTAAFCDEARACVQKEETNNQQAADGQQLPASPLFNYFTTLIASDEECAKTLEALVRIGKLQNCVSRISAEMCDRLLQDVVSVCEKNELRENGVAFDVSAFFQMLSAYKFQELADTRFSMVYEEIIDLCTYSVKVSAVLRDILAAASVKGGAQEKRSKVNLALFNFIQEISEMGDKCLSSVLKERAKAELSFSHLQTLHALIDRFTAASTRYSGKKPQQTLQLLGVISRDYLDSFTNVEEAKINQFLTDEELWSDAKITPATQKLVDGIVTGTPGDVDHSLLFQDPAVQQQEQQIKDNNQTPYEAQPTIQIGSKQYKVLKTVIKVIAVIDTLMVVPKSIPILATDVAKRIAQIIQSFNTRLNKLILGTELTKVARVGTHPEARAVTKITAKLLVLTSQTLTALIDLLPFITSYVVTDLLDGFTGQQQQQQKRLLDSAAEALSTHNQHIFDKIVSIVKDRVQHHFFADIDAVIGWYCPKDPTKPLAPPPSPFSSLLLKDTKNLHRIIRNYLHTEQLKSVFADIFTMINTDLMKLMTKYDFQSTITGPRRLYNDMTVLMKALGELEDIDPPPSTLLNAISAKYPLVGITSQAAKDKN